MSTIAVKICKALADTTRIAALKDLLQEKELSCQELMKRFDLSQPTLSHHFNKLVDAKILLSRKEGVLWFYSLNNAYLKNHGIDLKKLLTAVEKEVK